MAAPDRYTETWHVAEAERILFDLTEDTMVTERLAMAVRALAHAQLAVYYDQAKPKP